VTINAPAAVTPTPASLEFTTCNDFQDVVFTSSTAGDYSITVSVSDSGVGSYTEGPATFTLHVLAGSDSTAPTVTCTVPDQTIWYGTNVSVPCIATDAGSPPASPASFVLATTVNSGSETSSASTGTQVVCDSASTPNCVTAGPYIFKVDLKAPEVTCGSEDSVWHAINQDVSCTATDDGSGLADPGDASFTLSTSVADDTVDGNAFTDSRTVYDGVSNGNTGGPVGPFMIDREDPAITLTTPSNGAVYTLGQVVNASYSCDDGLGSGILAANCVGDVANGSPIDTSSIGGHTFTVNAEDNVGNTSSATHDYTVIYNFLGFFRPIDNLPTLNVVKAGSGIPVKFSLSGYQGLDIFATAPTSRVINCDTSADMDSIETTVTAGGSSLTYDAVADQYVYVWKTDKAWAGSCRQLVVTLADGTVHLANFKFTKF
jgi:hypothetical protein